jgi:hypothetical protein
MPIGVAEIVGQPDMRRHVSSVPVEGTLRIEARIVSVGGGQRFLKSAAAGR